VPVLADRLVKVCTAAEAWLRAVTTEQMQGTSHNDPGKIISFLQCALVGAGTGVDGSGMYIPKSPLVLHMGLRGPAAQATEQQRFYSLLSTVQKLGRCKSGLGSKLCWGQHGANKCCWAAAHAAVQLLQAARVVPAVGSAAAVAADAGGPPVGKEAQATPAAVEQQQPEFECLPSLVIFGRSCLVWAEQLRQQAPELLVLLASEPDVQQQQQHQEEGRPLSDGEEPGGVQVPYSATFTCVPCQPGGDSAASLPPWQLEVLVSAVLAWVGSVTSEAAHTALAAAAGGDLQQFRQQLEALSAAQQVVRQEGVTDASLAALVQQLQETGVMLSNIAVPHFCNNPACVNISGATEVQLVSGRSCICAGCHTARYCGRVCQRQAWQQHKPVCKALAAAAAAAEGTQK
jgi:hypothetical protein